MTSGIRLTMKAAVRRPCLYMVVLALLLSTAPSAEADVKHGKTTGHHASTSQPAKNADAAHKAEVAKPATDTKPSVDQKDVPTVQASEGSAPPSREGAQQSQDSLQAGAGQQSGQPQPSVHSPPIERQPLNTVLNQKEDALGILSVIGGELGLLMIASIMLFCLVVLQVWQFVAWKLAMKALLRSETSTDLLSRLEELTGEAQRLFAALSNLKEDLRASTDSGESGDSGWTQRAIRPISQYRPQDYIRYPENSSYQSSVRVTQAPASQSSDFEGGREFSISEDNKILEDYGHVLEDKSLRQEFLDKYQVTGARRSGTASANFSADADASQASTWAVPLSDSSWLLLPGTDFVKNRTTSLKGMPALQEYFGGAYDVRAGDGLPRIERPARATRDRQSSSFMVTSKGILTGAG